MSAFDTVIRGGTIIEGTRLPRFRSDIGIKNGRITKIGTIEPGSGDKELDAEGLIVAPGFVDLHTHYDAQIHWDPYCTISGWHGVTSVVLGNCGFGFAPVKPEDRDRSLLMMTRTEQIPYETMVEGMPINWETFPEWLDNLDDIKKGVNVISYMAVNPLMIYVMGLEAAKSRPATPEEQVEMQRLLNEAMDAGACGFSIQRMGKNTVQADYDGTPMPTDTMTDEDIFALAKVLRRRNEGFIQITQAKGQIDATASEGDMSEGLNADREFIEALAAESGRPIIYNAIFAFDELPEYHTEMLKWVADCNARGLRIIGQGSSNRACMQMTFEDWNLYDSSPVWNEATQGTNEEKLQKLSDPTIRQRMKDTEAQLVTLSVGGPIEGLTVKTNGGNPELDKYVGKTIKQIAEEDGKHTIDAMLDIAVAGDLKPEFLTGSAGGSLTNADIVAELVSDQHVIPGLSDGGAHTKFFAGGSYTTDLLTWLVRDTGKMTLEEAHYHLSYLPAQAAGFPDRGYIKVGAPADIVVYDLENLKRIPEMELEVIRDFPANEWRRVQRAEGYRYIMVNGEVTFEDGVCTNATPGQLLRHGRFEGALQAAE